ncbi:hypothetical protein CHUAL_011506 [Chamberlinius hualienensis]
MLAQMLSQEKQNWPSPGNCMYNKLWDRRTKNLRDAVTRWLLTVHYKLGYSPDTFDLSVAILDRFLVLVKAQPKYLKCIAISSYFLAAKCMEEDEIILATCDLVDISKAGCSVAEVLRMERVILSKLKWDPLSKTVLNFVHLLYALLIINEDRLIGPIEADKQLTSLIIKLYTCLCDYEVRSFTPSTLAVALMSFELGYYTQKWLAITIGLQNEIKLENQELARCRAVIANILERSRFTNFNLFKVWKGGAKPCKRKVEQTEVDDDVYEGIKRLYGDDGLVHDSMFSCGTQAVLASPAIVNLTVATVTAL